MSPSTQLPELGPGDTVAGRFRVVDFLGKGGFSVVFRAYQETMQRHVALKILKPSISDDESVVERFRREALFTSNLSHPNTITLFDYGQTDAGLCYIAMEHLDGTDLADVLDGSTGFPLTRVWNILVQSARSLAEAHDQGLIHRDVKPENIFLVDRDDREFVKMLDFGLSKAVQNFQHQNSSDHGAMTPLTQEGKVFGTPLYMAPEQARDEEISPSIDVYALGHIAYEMITGKARYQDISSAMDIMLRQIYDPPLELPDPWADTPFADLIEDATRKDAEDRIGDAEALTDRLTGPAFEQWMAGQSGADDFEPDESVDHWRPGIGSEPSTVDVDDDVGFDKELGQLHEALDETTDRGLPRVALVQGARGSGRTHLLHEFLEDCRDRDDLAVLHRHDPSDDDATEDRRLLDDVDALTDRLEVAIDESTLRADPHGDSVDDDRGADDQNWSRRESAFFGALDEQRQARLANIGRAIRACAEQTPLVWALERLESTDALTLAALSWLFQDVENDPAPIFITATFSQEDLVDRTGLLRYVQKILNASEPVVRRINVRSAGDQSEETDGLMTTIGDSPLDLDSAGEDDEEGESTDLFDRAVGLLARLGDDVEVELWSAVADEVLAEESTEQLEFALQQAEQFGIVDREEGVLSFGRPTFGDKVRKQLDEHDPFDSDDYRRIAETLRGFESDPSRARIKQIVDHYRRAGEWGRAVAMLHRAGASAYSDFDLDTAREYYLQLQQLLEERPEDVELDLRDALDTEPARIWLRIGEIHAAIEEHGAAEKALQRAAREAEGRAPLARARAFKLLGDLRAAHGRYESAEGAYRSAAQEFEAADREPEAVGARSLLGEALLRRGRVEAARDELESTLQRAERLDHDVLLARTDFRLGRVYSALAEFDDAVEHLDRACRQFDDTDNPDEAVRAYHTYGEAAYAGRRLEVAGACFEAARVRARDVHSLGDRFPTLGLVRTRAASAKWDDAETLLAAPDSPDYADESYPRARWAEHRGDLAFARGEYERALGAYSEMRDEARRVGRTKFYVRAMLRSAFARASSSSADRARRILENAARFTATHNVEIQNLAVRANSRYLELRLADFDGDATEFAEIIQRATDEGWGALRAVAQLFLADCRVHEGKPAPARELLERARQDAARVGEFAFLPVVDSRLGALDGAPSEDDVPGELIGTFVPPQVGLLTPDTLYGQT